MNMVRDSGSRYVTGKLLKNVKTYNADSKLLSRLPDLHLDIPSDTICGLLVGCAFKPP